MTPLEFFPDGFTMSMASFWSWFWEGALPLCGNAWTTDGVGFTWDSMPLSVCIF